MGGLKARFFPKLPAEERERRLHLFRTLLLAQLAATLLLIGVILSDTLQEYPHYTPLMVGLSLACAALSLMGYFLARRANYHLGASLLLLALLAMLLFSVAFYGSRGPIPFLLVWPIMVAAVLLEPPMTLVITTLAALAYLAISFLELYQIGTIPLFQARTDLFAIWHRPQEPFVFRRYLNDTANVVITYYAAAFLSWISSRSLRQAAERSQAQAAELERYRLGLEEQVASRTAELSRALEQLQASVQVIREVGSPVLPILEGVILTPLIGTMDSERARMVMDQVLHGIVREKARVAILDITGVPMVDTAVANALVQTAQGARLLGATPVLVGIRSEVAQTLIELGVNLQGIVTRTSLQEGLEYALQTLGDRTPGPLPGATRLPIRVTEGRR
ncbi:MAG: STAS domain-containing protein [Chloroflexia bacterium]